MVAENQCVTKSEWTFEPQTETIKAVGFGGCLIVTRDQYSNIMVCFDTCKVSYIIAN